MTPTTLNPHTLVAIVFVSRNRHGQVTHHVPQAETCELDEHFVFFDGNQLKYMDGEELKSIEPGQQIEIGEFTIRFDSVKQAKDIDGWTEQVDVLDQDDTEVRLDDKFDATPDGVTIEGFPDSDQDWPTAGLTVPQVDEDPPDDWFIGHAVG